MEKIEIDGEHVSWVYRDIKERTEMSATRTEAGLLKGPARLEMGKRINETLKESVQVGLAASAGKKIFEGTGQHAGLKVFPPEHLLRMVKVYDLV